MTAALRLLPGMYLHAPKGGGEVLIDHPQVQEGLAAVRVGTLSP